MYKVDRDMDGHYAGDTSYQSKCHRAGMSWRKCKRVYLELTSISLHVSHFHKKAKQNQTYIHQYPLAELLQKAESNIFVSPHTANRLNEASIGHVSLLLQLLPGQNTEVGSRSLLLGIFPIQGSNPVSRIAGGCFTSWATGCLFIYLIYSSVYLLISNS